MTFRWPGCLCWYLVALTVLSAATTGAALDTSVRTRRVSTRAVPRFADLSRHLKRVVDSYNLAGLTVGIVQDNRLVYAKGFGVESLHSNARVTPSTIFHAASISKTFVATAIVQLAERGDLDLDVPLIEYLPYFSMADERFVDITVRQMLTHTSGFPNVEDYEWENPQYDNEALERYVRSLATQQMIAAPGAGWSYSNMAYDVLGDVIAKVSGMTFEEYEKEFVLDPSNMVNSTFLKPPSLPSNWASPHILMLTPRVWSGYPYNRRHAPSSTLHTSLPELAQWAMINLSRGRIGDRQILDPSAYSTLWQDHVSLPEGRGLFHSGGGQGFGWATANYRGDEVVGHSGSDVGFTSNLILVPARSIAVVVLCNSDSVVLGEITGLLLDAALGYELLAPIPPAAVSVCETLYEHGLDAAEEHWNYLRIDHPDEYEFGAWYFYYISEDIAIRGTEEEAAIFACLFRRIMPQDEIDNAIDVVRSAQRENPENRNLENILEILLEERSCP